MLSVIGARSASADEMIKSSPSFRPPPGLIHPSKEEALETKKTCQNVCQYILPVGLASSETKTSGSDVDDDETHVGSADSESEASDCGGSSRRSTGCDKASVELMAAFVPKTSLKFSSDVAPFVPSFQPAVTRTKLTNKAPAFVPRMIPVYLQQDSSTVEPTKDLMPPPGLRTKLSSVAQSFKPRVAA